MCKIYLRKNNIEIEVRLNGLKKYHYNKLYKMSINCFTCKISVGKYGYKKCLKNLIKDKSQYNYDEAKSAAEHGHLECLRKAHENGYTMDGICYIAAENGHLECLKYAHENGDKCNEKTCAVACESDSLDILTYLHENNCPWDKRTCEIAAEYDHLYCLNDAHENGCLWDKETINMGTKNKNIKCLEYAYENHCPIEIEMINEAACTGDSEIFKYVHEQLKLPFDYSTCTHCVLKDGSLECLKYAHENGPDWNTNTLQRALENNKYDCIKYLVENNCPCDEYVSIMAVKCCDLQTVKYLCENGIINLDDDILKHTNHNKKTNVTKYIFDKGCPIGSDIMIECAKYDKLNYLKYFQKKYNMSIDRDIFNIVIINDSIKCLKYIYKNYINLYDLYLSNNIYAISYKNCREFIRKILLQK